MKKYLFISIVSICIIMLMSCSVQNQKPIESNPINEKTEVKNENSEDFDASLYAKNFYEEYIDKDKYTENLTNGDLDEIKRKYMTENLIEELNLRSRQISADAITNSQDNTALQGKLSYSKGKDNNTAIISYRFDNPNGYDETNIELHFTDVNGKKLADELNTVVTLVENGKEVTRYEYKTKWANKPKFTDEDIKEIESIKKELDDNEAAGFIG